MVTLTLDDNIDTDRFDIQESFEALDGEKTGRLGVELAYMLLLGLGYMSDYKKKDAFTPATLEETAKRIESSDNESYNDSGFGIKLETLLTIADTVRAFVILRPFFVATGRELDRASMLVVQYCTSTIGKKELR